MKSFSEYLRRWRSSPGEKSAQGEGESQASAGSFSDWRFERKFRVENISRPLAAQIIRQHPAGFRPAFPDRWINNLYFDDRDFTALYDNLFGSADRRKVRLRWYGAAFPGGDYPARLEWKVRSNQLGAKRVEALPSLCFASPATLHAQLRPFWPQAVAHRPVLLNRYLRSYYTAGQGIRLTIDWELSFAEPVAAFRTGRFHFSAGGGVLELKYPPEAEDTAGWIAQNLPFRISKNSKYVAGLLAIHSR